MDKQHEKQLNTYHRMLEHVKSFVDDAEKEFGPKIQYGIDAAKEKAAELGELTREEIETISEYIKRDLVEAGDYLENNGKELSDWLKFDIELIEERFLDTFSVLADQTRLELDRLAQQANAQGEWHTGEIAGIGSLECKSCGEVLHFHQPGHIPPCPQCHATKFKRNFSASS